MQVLVFIWLVVGIGIGGVAVWLFVHSRSEELRKAINEAHEREDEAKAKAKESDNRHAEIVNELKVALEEKGKIPE